jgi:hypothetical protein
MIFRLNLNLTTNNSKKNISHLFLTRIYLFVQFMMIIIFSVKSLINIKILNYFFFKVYQLGTTPQNCNY